MENKEGDIILIKKGDKVQTLIPEHFLYSNRRGNFTLTEGVITIDDEFDYLCGEYVVYKTTFDGGGTGHGPHDIYPNGHHVWCEKLDDSKRKINFYQSGCFIHCNGYFEPVGKAKIQYIKE